MTEDIQHYGSLVFKIALFANLISVLFNVINDCDETYNYWEPLHFIVTQGHGGGFQTWEYSPSYGLRSYLYLWLVGWPAFLIALLGWPLWLGFLLVRLHLALWSVGALTYMSIVLDRVVPSNASGKSFGLPLSIWFCGLYALSPGSFISSTTFVPSGPATTLCQLMLAFWLSGHMFWAVGCVALTGILIWPFAAFLGVPLALHLIGSRRLLTLIIYACTWAVFLIPVTLSVDSYHFGRFVLAPWNIIRYNLFPSAQNVSSGSASQLYGVEPASFYLKNYVLNQNVVIGLTGCFMLFAFGQSLYALFTRAFRGFKTTATHSGPIPLYLTLICASPMILWNLIFFAQQHKEERFLFPGYPCISLGAAIFIYWFVQRIARLTRWLRVNQFFSTVVSLLVIIVFLLASTSRAVGLIRWYSAPIYLIRHLPHPNQTTAKPLLCLGRDWHYFPSRFLLPGNGDRWSVGYLQSNFSGQLPGHFTRVAGPQSTWIDSVRSDGSRFNADNREESDRFVTGGSAACDYILDRDSKPGPREKLYVADKKQWRSIATRAILEPHSCSKIAVSDEPWHSWISQYPILCHLFRAFYIPYVSEVTNRPVTMHILERLHRQAV
ncbi:Mannosyltransferase [Fasciola gigantica]|uniref:Mannosyltransferase n=1 Tax=Fasciola gigantica TaxID=46835 RepID=A0A504WV96_FASGI|nr:Mannosyltransferase [Fasciola gigantica]